MPTIDVDPSRLAAVFGRKERARANAVRDSMLEAALLGAEIVAEAVPHDQGILRSSVHAIRTGTGAEVVADAPHAGVIEGGSRPHLPPLQPLIDWVIRHANLFDLNRRRLRPLAMGPVRTARQQRTRDAAIAESAAAVGIAEAIQHKIALKGSEPTWFMKNSLPKMARALKAIVAEALKRPTP